jgi:hypothetical protein
MKCKLTFALLLISICGYSQSNLSDTLKKKKTYPINFLEKDFDNIDSFNGKIIAFDADISHIENSRNNTPYYKLTLGEKSIWAVLMFKNKMNIVGNTIRVVGYLSEIPKEEEKATQNKYHVICFGLIDLKNGKMLFISGAKNQEKEWKDGKIPSQ